MNKPTKMVHLRLDLTLQETRLLALAIQSAQNRAKHSAGRGFSGDIARAHQSVADAYDSLAIKIEEALGDPF